MERAQRQIRRSGARLCFEITGNIAAIDQQRAFGNMKDLRDAGVGIAIANHGATPSSLASLRALPARELKIDSAVIANMARRNTDALLLKSVIDLGHSLGMTITAEGVEKAEAMSLLQSMGADAAQGSLIARAMPLDEFLKFEIALPPSVRTATALKGLA